LDIMKRMSNLIKDPDLERLDIEMNTPNFFQILKVERREIRHSNFLAWLLDPNGSHGLSELFTKKKLLILSSRIDRTNFLKRVK